MGRGGRGWQGEEAGDGKGRRQGMARGGGRGWEGKEAGTEVVGKKNRIISKSERRAQSHTSVAVLIVAFRTLSTPARAS